MIKTCAFCGKEFDTKGKHSEQIFCCRECADNAKKKDLTGQKFNHWTVLKFDKKYKGRYYWLCKCDCGTIRSVEVRKLKYNGSKSCGCIINKKMKPGEGLALPYYTSISKTLSRMLERCENPKNTRYKNYGGRGITVCKEWHDYRNFYKWAIENNYEPGLTIERIDVNGNYCPENCKWITKKQQAQNTTKSILVTINGETHCLSEWCRILNMPIGTVMSRVFGLKWNIGKSLIAPIRRASNKADIPPKV